MRHDLLSTIAGGFLVLEGIGIAVLAVMQAGAIFGGDTAVIDTALALLVLTVICAAAVVAFGVAVMRGRSWGRSGGIVTQLLILAIALGAATGAYAHPLLGLELAIPAIITFVLLVAAARRSAKAEGASPDAP
ncbi:histidine kinase [Microbacterium caowuchunii]|uniref:Histidine kinase n=1 Tax=Microbacterium caowuchunii TaxID=2614638 RepID=A0A5N0T9U8_9MICO|nr:histidine kinase [Microbacterium caowuchunii]KAA9130089.1 histidine kinase [Microbacterium caowuchunii]